MNNPQNAPNSPPNRTGPNSAVKNSTNQNSTAQNNTAQNSSSPAMKATPRRWFAPFSQSHSTPPCPLLSRDNRADQRNQRAVQPAAHRAAAQPGQPEDMGVIQQPKADTLQPGQTPPSRNDMIVQRFMVVNGFLLLIVLSLFFMFYS